MLVRLALVSFLLAFSACKAAGTPPESTPTKSQPSQPANESGSPMASAPPQGLQPDAGEESDQEVVHSNVEIAGACDIKRDESGAPHLDAKTNKASIDPAFDACRRDLGYKPALCGSVGTQQCACVLGGIGC